MTTMTTTPTRRDRGAMTATGPGTATVFARACRAEWTRLWTVRATWWFLAAAAVTTIGIGAALGLDSATGPQANEVPEFPGWLAGGISAVPAQFALLALVLLAVTADYGTGGIVPALQWTPRRGVLLTARVLVTVTVATVIGVLLAAGSGLAAHLAWPILRMPLDEGATILGWIALVYACGTAMTVGLGFLFRSTAGGMVTMFLVMLVLPMLLPAFGFDWMTRLAELLPGTGVVYLLLGEGIDITRTWAIGLLVVWAVAALLLGGLRFLRTDADR